MTSDSMSIEAPHSGYHWRGQSERFFEGWYLRVTLSALAEPLQGRIAQTFAFMYSIDDPAGNSPHSGGAAQILGPDESYYCRTFPNVHRFSASPNRLAVSHQRVISRANRQASNQASKQDTGYIDNQTEGYRFTAHYHQGRLLNSTGALQAEWEYSIKPLATWGRLDSPRATAGWLSYLSVFEPGWQVLMADGLASGQIYWQGKTYDFQDEPAYTEKNWGGAFPSKWFWLQCNAFPSAPGLSITAAGGVRDVLFLKENVGLIGIHYQGEFYEFISTKVTFAWTVDPWGYWHLSAHDYRYRVEITGRAHDQGAYVRVPTREGMQWLCRDTTHGELRVQLWSVDGPQIIDAISNLAGLEVGGSPWEEPWVIES
ncbi:tocopherol cyclase family protein [cf. Phormidesmis sp. LEGE 11477]|uniref:tocopherol cyclase family protein n=1 Tax=cf. Phormidesmis sp. LEGE 11477 TaxID=1828680 RepID=UPI00188153E1|nr:tocopherol cyclase family protein [cf. Phormidesmis sp. LEGE 11477]MBE9063867.1 tocopherol cyclase family protein [cf. Phormidesmis sp. LEGE 11477]